ncbi:unnamed protein product [Trichobilharzia szidati]|nr:unnamed protein product [Trichobilharzia szidati]
MVNKSVIKKNVKPNIIFVGSVVSTEDHGYLLDSGVPGMSCFLPTDQASGTLSIGSLVAFTPYVSDPLNFMGNDRDRVIKVTTHMDPKLSVLKPDSHVHFDCILPGTCVSASIIKKVTSTLVAQFSDYLISISRTHYSGKKENYQVGSNVVVCIIMVDPSTKQLTGSLLPHLVNPIPSTFDVSEMFTKCAVGTRFSDAVVKRVTKRAVFVSLPKTKGLKAVIKKPKTGPNKNECFSSLVVDSKVTCRIIDHDFLENLSIATVNKKLLALPFLSLHELKAGVKVSALIKRYVKSGIAVQVEGRLHGLIPYLHTTDVNLKDHREKFKAGEKVSCLVLYVDKCANKLLLTAKPGLLDSKFAIFGSQEMHNALDNGSYRDSYFTGFIVKVSENGLLVSGLENIRGWIPKRECGLSSEDTLQKNFYRGQVLKVKIKRILNVSSAYNSEDGNQCTRSKYLLSLQFNSTTKKIKSKNSSEFLQSVEVGQIFKATVDKVGDIGLNVNLCDNTKESVVLGSGYLPFVQLSDYTSNQTLLTQYIHNLKLGSTLDWNQFEHSVVIIGKDKETVTLSSRPTLLQAAEDLKVCVNNDEIETVGRPSFLRSFNELQVGSQWFAWVSDHRDYGVLVTFPSGVRGLAPKHLLSEHHLPADSDWKQLFPLHATVIAKIVEVDKQKHRCLISLKMFDIYNAEVHYVGLSIRSLKYWLTERQWISDRHKLLSSFRIGDQVLFEVKSLDNSLISGTAYKTSKKNKNKEDSCVRAITYKENSIKTDCVVSQTYPAIVCFVDHQKSQLELVLSPWLVNGVMNRKENVSSQLKPKQQVSSVVLAQYSPDMVVVGLRGHAAGLLGVLPARRIFNDVSGANAWCVGQRNKVTFRESYKQDSGSMELKLCTLSIYDPIEQDQVKQSKEQKKKENQVNAKINAGLKIRSCVSLQPGDSVTDLYFIGISSQTAFFAVGSADGQHVLCHLINWENSVKAIRAFLNNPPEIGTKIEKNAIVLFSRMEDKLIPKRRSKGLRSKMAEISFLEKPNVSVGQLTCAQLSRSKDDHWTVFLPGGSFGWLHVTDMNHSDLEVKPLDLTKTPDASTPMNIFNIFENLNQIKPHYFITCRIVGQKEKLPNTIEDNNNNHNNNSLNVDRKNEVTYFVSNKLQLIRDSGEITIPQQPTGELPALNVPVDGFVKLVMSSGIKLCLSRTTDIIVPFSPELLNRLKQCGIQFKVGDHLLVRPKCLVHGKLVGELVCNNSAGCEQIQESRMNTLLENFFKEFSEQIKALQSEKPKSIDFVDETDHHPSMDVSRCLKSSAESDSAVNQNDDDDDEPKKKKKKLSPTKQQEKKSRKRKLSTGDETIQSSNDNKETTTSPKKEVNASGKKRLRLSDSNSQNVEPLDQMKIGEKVNHESTVDKSVDKSSLPTSYCSKKDNVFSKSLIEKYQQFMFPGDVVKPSENGVETSESLDFSSKQLNANTKHEEDTQVDKEWRLRQVELRQAMLAALTIEQQCLPKGELHPQTNEEFELAVRNAPSNEVCWIAYMTHVLSSCTHQKCTNSDLNKGVINARVIAERGLKSISNSPGVNQLVKQSRLLTSYLIMEAKELERLTTIQKQQQYHMSASSVTSMSDLVLEVNNQSKRVSQLLTQLLNLDQAPFIRRAIDTLSDIGHHTRAEDLARRQIKSSPGDVDRWLSLIKVRFRAANVEAAREAQRNAASVLKASLLPQLAVGVARIEFEFGDVDRGIRLLQEQLNVHPKRKQLYEECIKLLMVNGKLKEARLIQQQAEKHLKPAQCTSINALFEDKIKH